MGKRVFMFPGQGSQYVGMGKGFYDSMPQVKEIKHNRVHTDLHAYSRSCTL